MDHELAGGAFSLAALNGDAGFYDKVMAALKNPKSPEEYYSTSSLCRSSAITNCLQRTLDFAISPDVDRRMRWDWSPAFWKIRPGRNWHGISFGSTGPKLEKAGGPFASAQVVGATSVFCDAGMRDQVTEFFNAHKVAAAERTYKQSIERINNCVDLKSQQETQLASWLGQHGTAGGK